MTLSEIRQDIKKEEAKGMELTASSFKYCFGKGMKELNQLVSEGIFEVSGETNDGRKLYKII